MDTKISDSPLHGSPMEEGAALLHAIQDVYLSPEVTIA